MVLMRPRMFLDCTKKLCKLNYVKIKGIFHNLCRNFAIICLKSSLLASKSVFLRGNGSGNVQNWRLMPLSIRCLSFPSFLFRNVQYLWPYWIFRPFGKSEFYLPRLLTQCIWLNFFSKGSINKMDFAVANTNVVHSW